MTPSNPTDGGPDTRTCTDCGGVILMGCECSCTYDWQDWLTAACESMRDASNYTHDQLRRQRAGRLMLLIVAQSALQLAIDKLP